MSQADAFAFAALKEKGSGKGDELEDQAVIKLPKEQREVTQ